MREKLIDLIEKSGMVENRNRCKIIADELLAAGVCFAPIEFVIRKDITDDMLRQMQNALSMPAMIMPYTPEQESVEIIPRWIPVSERLPEKEGRYLVYDCDTGNYYDSYFDETEGEFGEWQNCFDPHTLGVIDCEWNSCPNVTHWMPLPPPPEDVEDG